MLYCVCPKHTQVYIMNIEEKRLVLHDKLGELTQELEDKDVEVVYKYLDAVVQFKEMCALSAKIDPSEEQDWYSLSMGFFIAKGITGDSVSDENDREDFYDVAILSCACRYTYHYWC